MKTRLTSAAAVLWAFCFVSAVLAQIPTNPSKPGAEHEKLATFVGKWAAEADFKSSDSSSGAKSNWTETCQWFDGNYALNCHSEGDFGGRPFKEISVKAYNEAEKGYVYFETNSIQETDLWQGKVDGDTWTWTEKSVTHGRLTETRFTQRFSGDSISFKLEEAIGDAPFKLVMTGKQTRLN